MPLLKPHRLAAGQTIGLIAPASTTEDDDAIRLALETVESLGFRVRAGAHLFARHGYFAGRDAQRLADLHAMFADESVDAIFVLRGGWGSSRLLPGLDFDLIRHHPKVLLGYSDITSLLNPITALTGLVTFHGPIGGQVFTAYTLDEWRRVLVEPQAPLIIGAPPPHEAAPGQVERVNRLTTLVGGQAQGRLLGGNLTLLAHLAGTPYFPNLTDAILFLEDIGEQVYRIDRMLTQLRLTGALTGVAGVVFGKFTDCRPTYSSGRSLTLEEVLGEWSQAIGAPALRGLMIGHVPDMTVLPLGCQAELDADAGTLTLLETGVV